MAQAYDFALDKIGMEIMSYQVCAPQKLHRNLSPCVFVSAAVNSTSLLCLPPTDLGRLHQLSQRSVSATLVSLARPHKAPPPVDCSCHSCVLREAVGSYAENQRITAVRRVYQRGCVNPMINIEQLWRDYSKYEEASEPPKRLFAQASPASDCPAEDQLVCLNYRVSTCTWPKR